MKKEWKVFMGEDCPNCGDNLEVLSECLEEDDTDSEKWFMDGDDVKCCADCGFISSLSVSDDGYAWVQDEDIDD